MATVTSSISNNNKNNGNDDGDNNDGIMLQEIPYIDLPEELNAIFVSLTPTTRYKLGYLSIGFQAFSNPNIINNNNNNNINGIMDRARQIIDRIDHVEALVMYHIPIELYPSIARIIQLSSLNTITIYHNEESFYEMFHNYRHRHNNNNNKNNHHHLNLEQLIKNNSSIHTFGFRYCHSLELQPFMELIQTNTNLKTFELNDCSLNDPENDVTMEELGTMLRNHPSLQTIILDDPELVQNLASPPTTTNTTTDAATATGGDHTTTTDDDEENQDQDQDQDQDHSLGNRQNGDNSSNTILGAGTLQEIRIENSSPIGMIAALIHVIPYIPNLKILQFGGRRDVHLKDSLMKAFQKCSKLQTIRCIQNKNFITTKDEILINTWVQRNQLLEQWMQATTTTTSTSATATATAAKTFTMNDSDNDRDDTNNNNHHDNHHNGRQEKQAKQGIPKCLWPQFLVMIQSIVNSTDILYKLVSSVQSPLFEHVLLFPHDQKEEKAINIESSISSTSTSKKNGDDGDDDANENDDNEKQVIPTGEEGEDPNKDEPMMKRPKI